MKVLIVAKTRMGAGACIGAITAQGESVRLRAADEEVNERFNLEYNIGDVWELLEVHRSPQVEAPHTEDLVVGAKRFERPSGRLLEAIQRFMPPTHGGIGALYDGHVRCTAKGRLYIGHEAVPPYSTQFWRPDRPLHFSTSTNGHFRYTYDDDDACHFAYVGFESPVEVIPAGTLVRVSLARWWTPRDHPETESRCYVQISGWFEEDAAPLEHLPLGVPRHTALPRVEADIHALLHTHFGFREFRPLQQEIVEAVLARRDVVAVMATGSGKSLCYQLPALAFGGLTVVISPLISLMEDQVAHLRQWGIAAAALHSQLPSREYAATVQAARAGTLNLLYLAPETLLMPHIRALLTGGTVECLVVDEAHCISDWGHDFRPEYRRIVDVRAEFPHIPCLALTATATPRVRDEIVASLQMNEGLSVVGPFDRPNLFIAVQERRQGIQQILDFLAGYPDQSGIVYCNTRQQVDDVTAALQAAGVDAAGYHAGMDDPARAEHQRRFSRDDLRVVVATVAFGMGIDKPDIRYVVHYNMPKNLETYFQQIGRAGRDGERADCLLLYSTQDFVTARALVDLSDGSDAHKQHQRVLVQQMIDWVQSTICRRRQLLAYFGQEAAETCGMCDTCLAGPQAQPDDLTEYARLFFDCVRRTGELFGAGHLVDILRGSQAQKILQRRHDQLDCHGAGRALAREQWMDLVTQFRQQQFIALTEHGGLKLTDAGRAVLGGETVRGRLSSAQPAAPAAPHTGGLRYDEELFGLLRALRKRVADEERLAPYMVFSDRSLQEMASYYPQSQDAFATIHGVGEHKLARYAETFTEAIREYCEPRQLGERPTPARGSIPTPVSGRAGRMAQAVAALQAGHSLPEIARMVGVSPNTLVGYFAEHLDKGESLDPNLLLALSELDAEEQDAVFARFDELGAAALGPVFAALDGRVDYRELHLLRLCYRIR